MIAVPLPPTVRPARRPLYALAVCVLALALVGCRAREAQVRVDNQVFTVEIAETAEQRARGLMYRAQLPPDRGMLFVQPRAAVVNFWMKNTRMPLDLLYFDVRGRLVELHRDTPPCTTAQCPTYPSRGAVRYVLEIAGGEAARRGIRPGARLGLGALAFEPTP